jgi:hypothetical protein
LPNLLPKFENTGQHFTRPFNLRAHLYAAARCSRVSGSDPNKQNEHGKANSRHDPRAHSIVTENL